MKGSEGQYRFSYCWGNPVCFMDSLRKGSTAQSRSRHLSVIGFWGRFPEHAWLQVDPGQTSLAHITNLMCLTRDMKLPGYLISSVTDGGLLSKADCSPQGTQVYMLRKHEAPSYVL
jgi:hypothetical protein